MMDITKSREEFEAWLKSKMPTTYRLAFECGDDDELTNLAKASVLDMRTAYQAGRDPSLPGAEATVITHYYTPDGYKLVPTEITKAMRDAWDSAPNGHEDDDVNMCNAYRAMIAAAPEKPL